MGERKSSDPVKGRPTLVSCIVAGVGSGVKGFAHGVVVRIDSESSERGVVGWFL